VEQWARKEEQGAGNSRSHARSLSGLGGEAVAGGSGGGGEERGERSICEQQYMMVGGRPFLRVSSRPVLHAGRDSDSRSSSARRRESPPSSKRRPRFSLNCRVVQTRAAFQLCCSANFHLPTCSGIGEILKTLPRVRRQEAGTRSFLPSMPCTLLPSTVHDHSTLANIHADQHMPAEQPPRPSRCLSTSRPPSST